MYLVGCRFNFLCCFLVSFGVVRRDMTQGIDTSNLYHDKEADFPTDYNGKGDNRKALTHPTDDRRVQ